MTTTDEVMEEIEILQQNLNNIDLPLKDLPEAINNREIGKIRESIQTDEDDKDAIGKWFNHYENRDQKQSEVTSIAVRNSSGEVEYVIVQSEMHSDRKKNIGDNGNYHARWVVGRDDSSVQDVFIHRVEWEHSFENPLDELENPLETVKQWLGFEEYLPSDPSDIQNGIWYQAQGDIAIQFNSYESYVNNKVRNRVNNEIKSAKEEAYESWEDTGHQFILSDDIRISRSLSRLSVTVKPSSTGDLKELQNELGFSEETVRNKMRDDWKQLTAKRRKKVIKRLIRNDIKNHLKEVTPNKEDIKPQIKHEVVSEIADSISQQNAIIGNHLLICEKGINERATRGTQAKIVIPEESDIHLIHDEHSNKTITVGESIIKVKVLNRHEQA